MAFLVVLKRKEDKNADQVKTKSHCDSNPLLLKGILNFVIPAGRRSDPANAGRLADDIVLLRGGRHLPPLLVGRRPWLFLQVMRVSGSRETSGNRAAVVAPCVSTIYGDSVVTSNATTPIKLL
jgi:hypothetical protein